MCNLSEEKLLNCLFYVNSKLFFSPNIKMKTTVVKRYLSDASQNGHREKVYK